MFSYLSLASPLTVCGTSLCLRPTSFGILLSGLKRTPGICPSFNPKYILSAWARISGNQLELAEPGLGGRASMSTEQVKRSCGSMSRKAAPSIKLNKSGSPAGTNSACSWRQTPLRHAVFGKPSIPFFTFTFLPSYAKTLIHHCASDSPPCECWRPCPPSPCPALIQPRALGQSAFQT